MGIVHQEEERNCLLKLTDAISSFIPIPLLEEDGMRVQLVPPNLGAAVLVHMLLVL